MADAGLPVMGEHAVLANDAFGDLLSQIGAVNLKLVLLADALIPPAQQEAREVDVVVNYIAGDTWLESLKIIHPGGRMLTCGATAGYATSTDIRYIWTYEINIMGSNGWTRDDQAEMMRMVVDGEIEPILHAVRPLSETAASIQQIMDREVFGKIVLQP